MKKTIAIFFTTLSILLLCTTLMGQNERYTLSGYIEDAESGEKLLAATVFEKTTASGTISNTFGFYSLTLPAGTYEIQFSYIGFQTQIITVVLDKNVNQNISLGASIDLDVVEIVAEEVEKIEEKTQMSTIDIPIKEIKKLPALLGEVDVLKIIQLMPGVQSGTEGTSGIYVRGGGPDQNLILLDGVPVYNVSHLGGFFSVFNADAVRNVELIKGGFPARYGGRLSSVVNITLKEGNKNHLKAEGSIGLISSKLTIEGPLGKKKKTSFIVSGRRTYIDLLTRPLIKAAGKQTGSYSNGEDATTNFSYSGTGGYFFYDLNAKVNHQLTKKDRLYLSFYSGRDIGDSKTEGQDQTIKTNGDITSESNYDDEFSINWGNLITALRWNHEFSPRLFANSTFTLSRYDFKTGNKSESDYFYVNQDQTGMPIDTFMSDDLFDFSYGSKVIDLGGKIDFDFLPSPNHYVKFGTNFTHHNFLPGELKYKEEYGNGEFNVDTSFAAQKIKANEIFVYAEDDYKVNDKFKINVGLHASLFDVQDTVYTSLEPRISARYLVKPNLSLKGSLVRMTQYLHLLTNASLALPTDLWVPPTNKVGPQRSWQFALGAAQTFDNTYEVSLEGYYKKITDILAYREGSSITLIGDDWEDGVTVGDGWSYGAELFLQKKKGRTTGWIGYTLSWSKRQFAGKQHPNIPDLYFEPLNFGEIFPYKYDRRHDLSIAVTHKHNDKWDFSGAFVYGTGNAITLPRVEYLANTNVENNYGGFYGSQPTIEENPGRNSHRIPAYHRLDLSVTKKSKPKKWGYGYWNLSVYNIYNRKNIFFIYRSDDFINGERQTGFKQLSPFTIIPSVSYKFEVVPKSARGDR